MRRHPEAQPVRPPSPLHIHILGNLGLIVLGGSLSSLASMKTEKLAMDRWKKEKPSDAPFVFTSALATVKLDASSGSGAQKTDTTDNRSVQAYQGSARGST